LAFPVVGAYQDVIAELELDVLTDPSIYQSQELYILTSELSLLKSTISPIVGLVSSLRDHKKSFSGASKAFMGVEVSEVTKTYLGDVDDHLLLLLEVCDFYNAFPFDCVSDPCHCVTLY
jgi:Mg2+ and Co2+ transporter CorA